MVNISDNGKYVNIENVRVSYREKDDTIHITAVDPDLSDGFHLTLNQGSPTEDALRKILVAHGLIDLDANVSGLPKFVKPTQRGFYDWFEISLGVRPSGEIAVCNLMKTPHMFVYGETMSIRPVLNNIIHHVKQQTADLVAVGIDLSGREFVNAEKNGEIIVCRTNESSLQTLSEVNKLISKRYEDMEAQDVNFFREVIKEEPSEVDSKAIILIVSNINEFDMESSEDNKKFHTVLNRIVRMGQKAGVFVAVGAKETILNPESIKPLIAQCAFKAIIGETSVGNSEFILGDGSAAETETNIMGRGVYNTGAETSPFQTYYLSEEDN